MTPFEIFTISLTANVLGTGLAIFLSAKLLIKAFQESKKQDLDVQNQRRRQFIQALTDLKRRKQNEYDDDDGFGGIGGNS